LNIRNEKQMAMNIRKCESLKELPRKTHPRKVAPVLNTKFNPKSDLTVGFVDSSNYVNALASRSERHRKIDQMRNNAVTNQTTNLEFPVRIGSKKGIFKDMTKIKINEDAPNAYSPPKSKADDGSPSTPKYRPSGSKRMITLTPQNFRMKYSNAGRLGVGVKNIIITAPSLPTRSNMMSQS
jgi:hypothetical protein